MIFNHLNTPAFLPMYHQTTTLTAVHISVKNLIRYLLKSKIFHIYIYSSYMYNKTQINYIKNRLAFNFIRVTFL